MAKTPGLWIGMITEDLDHWKSYHNYNRLNNEDFLQTDVYEMHKKLYGETL